MKTHKLARSFFAVAVLSFLLSGCYPTGEVSISNNSSASKNTAENGGSSQSGETQDTEEVENLTVSVELPESWPNEVNAIDLSVKRWDDEAIKETLIGEKTISKTSQTPSDYYPGEFIQVYDTEDDWRLILQSGSISFENRGLLEKYHYGSFQNVFDQVYVENDMPDSLEGFSKSDAIEAVKELLDKLDITNVSEPDVYAISCEWATEFLREQSKQEPDVDYTRWTKDDEIYVLVFPLEYENVPLSTHWALIMGTDTFSQETYIKATVSKQGVIELNCEGIFEEKYEKGEIKPIKVDAKTALSLLVSSYSKRVLDPTTINKCRLVYFPCAVGENHVAYTYSPFWEFEVLEETRSIGTLKKYEYINAETGIGSTIYY